MTEIMIVTAHADVERLRAEIKTKAKGCNTPMCWTIREPYASNSKIWLKPKEVGFNSKKGKWVSVKRLLFYLEYGQLPLKNIYMACDKDKPPEERGKCINPAHMRMRGWEREGIFVEMIHHHIAKHWLYLDQAKEWYDYDPDAEWVIRKET